MSTTTTGSAYAEVEGLARDLVDKGRFETMPLARNYVFESRPELAEKVRAESQAQLDEVNAAKGVAKAVILRGAENEVERIARRLVDAGQFDTIQKARAHVYETDPKLWERVKAERA